ncbi:hypothetical protein DFH06DRAFT_1349509 [Mycena polygramma]|nr:hypothetical protein DFH06DRAFT_1349509 [Mycena polygramma]
MPNTRPFSYTPAPDAGPSHFQGGFGDTPKWKGKQRQKEPTIPENSSGEEADTEEEEQEARFARRRRRKPVATPPSSPEPPRMQAPAQATFSAPLRTSLDMPVRGSKEAPRTFRGRHTEVQLFIDHYDHLLNKCRVTDGRERCEFILNYCTIDVQNVIRTMESFQRRQWLKLRREILKYFDAERALQKYKPADVKKFAIKARGKACYNLTQWQKYFVKYNAIAGGPLDRGHLTQEDYFAYFQIGIHRNLRQVLENRILQTNPYRGDEVQYSLKEWNQAAEWYFRRDKYETLMIGAEELGEEIDEEFSGEDSRSGSSSSDFDSDYEEFRRKKKLKAKKKKDERKKKINGRTAATDRQKFQGNEDEVAGMIRKLNAMRLDDPEYAPIYYKVMVLDQSGTAKQCVKPPFAQQTERTDFAKKPRTSGEASKSPATYPNNIPLGTSGPAGGNDFKGCFGCLENGHRIFECRQVANLVQKKIIKFNDETRKLNMANGDIIRRNPGESLVQAAARIAGGGARVMMGAMDEDYERTEAVSYFYQQEECVHISEMEEDESESENSTTLNPRPESPQHVHPMLPPPSVSYALPFVNNPYESVQYLSQQQFHHPPPLILEHPLRPEDALAAIQEVLHEQWGRYRHSMPIDVHPTFSAAPQSKYVGSYSYPDGQLVHRSVAMNNLEVLTDERTGLPYTITGHTVRDTFSVPASADTVWPLELVYPSNERLHEEMSRCMQEVPEDDSGFPVHATHQQPPMPHYDANLGWPMPLVNVSRVPPVFTATEPVTPDMRRFNPERQATVAPNDTLLASAAPAGAESLPPLPDSPDSQSTASSMPELVPIPAADGGLAGLNRDISARATQDLTIHNDNVCGDRGAEGLGICAVCFEPEHDPWTPCPPQPNWRSPTPPFMIPGHPPTPPLFIAHQPREDSRSGPENDQRHQQEVHDMVHGALGPILEEFINMPAREEGAWDDLASKTREAREVFERLAAILVERQTEAEGLRIEAKQLEQSINDRIESLNKGTRVSGLTEAEYSAAHALTTLADPSTTSLLSPRLVASHVDRPTLDPRVRHSDSGIAYADAVPVPNLNKKSGDAITREVWSSSLDTNTSNESFDEVAPYTRYPNQPVVNNAGEISPAVSEWSVSTSDFAIDPRQIIDEAVNRVRIQRGDTGVSESNPVVPQDPLAQAYIATAVRALMEPAPQTFQSQLPTSHVHDLHCWVMEGAQCYAESLQWKDGIHGDPIRDALAPLALPFADYYPFSQSSESYSYTSGPDSVTDFAGFFLTYGFVFTSD